MPKVSIITPTHGRPEFLARAQAYVARQTFRDIEWLVLDDSEAEAETLRPDARLRYHHSPTRMSIGAKRNRLIENASGEIIVHFDDDDFYHPSYVEMLVQRFSDTQVDLLNLRGWFVYDRRHHFFGYWDLEQVAGPHFCCGPKGVEATMFGPGALHNNELGWGFGYSYRRKVWETQPFQDVNWNEDGLFALAARQQFGLAGYHDRSGLCLHLLHTGNTSTCYPQYALPAFMLEKHFPAEAWSLDEAVPGTVPLEAEVAS